MKKVYLIALICIVLASCKNEEEKLFDKSADERVAEAKAALKQDLTANPWKLKYKPEQGAGSFWMLLEFNDNDQVTIKSDLGSNEGKYYEQTISYRIDSSLGLELILETYSVFSFLFEQDQATFLAEYEFHYVNKTPDNALVFRSKTDVGNPTILLFQQASASDEALLGTEISQNLSQIGGDLEMITSSVRITYADIDLAFSASLDDIRRIITISSASRKSTPAGSSDLDFSTGYTIEGDSLIFDDALAGSFFGNNIILRSMKFNSFTEESLAICADPISVHSYEAVTSTNDDILVETTLADASDAGFSQTSFFFAPLSYIINNGETVVDEITSNIEGAAEMQLYYNFQGIYGIGFYIENPNGTITFALREFTPVLDGNRIIFNFEPEISIFNDPTQANVENINIYLNALTEGDNTYIFKLGDRLYELHNPCTGWSIVFITQN